MKDLPSNLPAESAVLGAALLDVNAAIQVVTSLTKEDFHSTKNQIIFSAVKRIFDRNEKVTPQGVTEILDNENNLEAVGGFQSIIDLADEVVYIADTEQNIKLIKDKSLLRSLIGLCQQINAEANELTMSVGDYLAEAESKILNITRQRKVGDFKTVKEIAEQIKERVKLPETAIGLKSGFNDLDNYLHGFQRGDLVILAARPSVGKTAFALNIAANIGKSKKRIALFSLEMAAVKLVERMLASVSLIPTDKMKNYKYLSNKEIGQIQQALDQIGNMDIYIDDSSFLTLGEIQAKSRKIEGLDMIIIDYIGLINSGNKRVESRQVEVAEYSRGLKALARELNVPVLVLSQLSRDNEKRRGDKRPALSDLRDSGAIEQDADVVLMLYREDYYKQNEIASGKSAADNIVEINIAKHRNGETGVVKMVFHRNTQRFTAFTPRNEEEE